MVFVKERRKLGDYAIGIMQSSDKKDRVYHCVDSGHVGIFESSQRSVVVQLRLWGKKTWWCIKKVSRASGFAVFLVGTGRSYSFRVQTPESSFLTCTGAEATEE